MNYPTTCQFCKTPITIEIDDEYCGKAGDARQGPLGDPFKLIHFSTCNACADLRVGRRQMEETIGKCCSLVALLPDAEVKKRMALRGILERVTQKYAKLIARWHRMDGELWEPAIVDSLMQNPNEWGDIISRMWRSFRQWKQEQQQATLPYKDT